MEKDWAQVRNRLNEIIQVDVMSSEKFDFLATHTPMDNLSVQWYGRIDAVKETYSEEEIYQNIVLNRENEHRMVIVRGQNGAGKSHLIRWLEARMSSDHSVDLTHEKIIFIRRLDNTLRNAVQQLLLQGAVLDPIVKEKLERVSSHSGTQSEEELKRTIYYAFVSKLETDTDTAVYSIATKKRLANFLKDSAITQALIGVDGPISRIYHLIAKSRGASDKDEANFLADDFTKLQALRKEVAPHGDAHTVLMMFKNQKEPEKFATYLNRFAADVVRQLVNITEGDIQEIVRDLRAALKREGKSLTVLIEDMTTFTGIDTELVKVLSVPHTGEYKDLCRVTSVIGITDAYYNAHFKDNFRDRVTHQITVDVGTFDRADTLGQLAARYINAAYLTTEEVEAWYQQGADQSSLPYKTWEPPFTWETQTIGERQFSLFPFNLTALTQLFHRLPEQTPRLFLRDVLKAQLMAWLSFKLGEGNFPDTTVHAVGTEAINFSNVEHMARLDKLPLSESARKRLRILLCLWGEGHFSETHRGSSTYIGGLPEKYLEIVGFTQLTGINSDSMTTQNITKNQVEAGQSKNTGTMSPLPTPVSPEQRAHERRRKDLDEWHRGESTLVYHEEFKNRVRSFVTQAINWQTEGVPAALVRRTLNGINKIYIEGQQRGSGRNDAIIFLSRDNDDYYALLALEMAHYHGHWQFESGAFLQLKAVEWLEKNKTKIIEQVRGEPGATPSSILRWLLATKYLVLALHGHLTPEDTSDSLIRKLFMNTSPREQNSWGQTWEGVATYIRGYINEIDESISELPNTHLGSVLEKSEVKVFHRSWIDEIIMDLEGRGWDPNTLLSEQTHEVKGFSYTVLTTLRKLTEKMNEAVQEEKKLLEETLQGLRKELGDVTQESVWIEATESIRLFLSDLNNVYGIHYDSRLLNTTQELQDNAKQLALMCRGAVLVGESGNFGQLCAYLSTNPRRLLAKASELIADVRVTAETEGKKAEQDYKAINGEREQVSLIADTRNALSQLINYLEELEDRYGAI